MLLFNKDIGSDAWWKAVAQRGTPIIEPAVAGLHPVTFLWRDPQGNESVSSTRRVWINITGVTDHHQRAAPQTLQRVAGTDVWQWQTRLDATWRGSYSLIPQQGDYPFRLQPDGTPEIAALRNWWRNIFPAATGDPLNFNRSWKSGRGHLTSPLHMPLASPQPWWLMADRMPHSATCNLTSYSWDSARLGNSRTVWALATGAKDPASRPLAILLDGQFWAQIMPVDGPLQAMTDAGELPEAVYLLIDSIDPPHRSHELPCNSDFWLALQQELLPQLASRMPYDTDPARTIVAGQSFGGLSAVYAALHWPQRFGCALSQSGSFWWPQRDMSAHADSSRWLLKQLEAGLARQSPLKFFLEAGLREPLILEVNDRLAQRLSEAGHHLHYRRINGGHDALCWRGGLTDGLRHLWTSAG